MKNANEKYVEYARVINMCKGTKFENEPWKCIRRESEVEYTGHPVFGNEFELKFAVAILEDEPLFVGDRLYHKDSGREIFVRNIENPSDVNKFTRTPPKRTFTLNDAELPRPVKDNFGLSDCRLKFYGKKYYFKTIEDRDKVACAIKNLLTPC